MWSAYRADAFLPRLTAAGFRAEAARVRAHAGKGARLLPTPQSRSISASSASAIILADARSIMG